MYNPEVFILTKRKELAIKHKKLVETLTVHIKFFQELMKQYPQLKTMNPK